MPTTPGKRFFQFFASVRTGIVLVILVVIAAAIGTVVLQRPMTDPDQMVRAYSPAVLTWLDRLGLTDVFHAWWFALLLALLSLSILFASIERFPVVWKFFARPYRRPEPHFRAVLPMQAEVPIVSAAEGIAAAERAFRRCHLKPQRIENGSVSLYAERNRFARLAAYVVHLSLLLIFVGGIVDAIYGYRGYLQLTEGEQKSTVDLRDGGRLKQLPFAIRCDGAGQENYPDGTPKRWWSKLAVLQNGKQVAYKEISVNDPLVYKGVRFYQSGFGMSGDLAWVKLVAKPKQAGAAPQQIVLRPGQPVQIDSATTVVITRFIPDFVIRDNEIYNRSNNPSNPAFQVQTVSQAGTTQQWVFAAYPEFSHPSEKAPYDFQFADMGMAYFTGLQVSHEPGQWGVWIGALLMALGLAAAFYLVHSRYWAVALDDGRGRQVLWVGGWASKNREEVAEKFKRLVQAIDQEVTTPAAAAEPEPALTAGGRR
jgi:cytochrome c biogenesis protein